MATSTFSTGRIVRAGLLGAAVAAVSNAVLFYVGSALGWIDSSVQIPNADGPLTVIPVIVASILPLLIATGLFLLLVRFTRRPVLIFGLIAVVALVLSLFQPFSIPGVPPAMAWTFSAMHVVAAAVIFWALRGSVTPEATR